MYSPQTSRRDQGFTLVELLTVIAIIAVLMGILFPTIGGALEGAKKTKAKSDQQAIVTAIKAYYAEYGRYPLDSSVTTDYAFGDTGSGKQEELMNVLRFPYKTTDTPPTSVTELNPRKITFLEVKDAKDFGKAGKEREGISGVGNGGKWLDPWGNEYIIFIDGDYDNSLPNPGYTNAGGATISTGVIVYSFGKDGVQGKKGDLKNFKGSDDVLSWQ